MKKTLHILIVFALMCAFCSCGLLPLDLVTTEKPQEGLALSAVEDGIRAARPTECRVTMLATYTDPAVTLTTRLHLKTNGGAQSYTYETERLLSTAAALAVGKPTETVSGYVHLVGDRTVSQSTEVDDELLAKIATLSLHLPRLLSENFSDLEIIEGGEGVTLRATVKNDRLAEMLDGEARLADLSFVMSLSKELTPTTLTANWTTPAGTPISYTAEYGYTAVAVP